MLHSIIRRFFLGTSRNTSRKKPQRTALRRLRVESLERRELLSASPLIGIADGSFEAPTIAPATFQTAPSGTPWSFSGAAGISSNGSPYTASNSNAPVGTQVAFITNGSSISQTINLNAGVYSVSFQAAQRANYQTQFQTIRILVDGNVVGQVTPASYNYLGAASYTYAPYQSNNFSVVAGLHTVTFQGLSPSTADSTAFIDVVSVGTVTDTLLDGGFEQPILAANTFTASPGGAPWLFSGSAGISRNGSGFQTNWTQAQNSPQGMQVAYLQGAGAGISQTVYLDAGNYQVSMQAAQRAIYQSHYQQLQVLFDGASVGTITPANTTFTSYQTSPFTATAGVHTITIVGTNPLGGDNTAFVDAVTLTQSTCINDGGFESPALGAFTYQVAPTGIPWQFTGTAGISTNGSSITSGNPSAPEGGQVGFITGNGSVSQSVYLYAGVYNVSMQAAQWVNNQTQTQTLQVLVDGASVGTIMPSNTSYSPYQSLNFTVATGTHTITLVGTNSSASSTVLFDLVATTAVTDTVSDGGFETPVLSAGGYQVAPSGSPWQFTGTAGLSANGSVYTGGNPNTPAGSQVAFITNNGGMSEAVYLDAGGYNISFLAAQRVNSQTAAQKIQILVDGAQVGVATSNSTNYYLYQTTNFAVAAGAHTIRFVGLNQQGGSVTALIDQVSIAPAEDGTTNNSARTLLSSAVSDGSFETPTMAANTFQSQPDGSPWVFTGSAGISANGSPFTGSNPNTGYGNQVGYIQCNGTISQAVYLDAGQYDVVFLAAQRASSQAQQQQIAILVDGTQVSVITPTTVNIASSSGTVTSSAATNYNSYQSANFTATAGMHTITFRGLVQPPTDSTVFIDAVSVLNTSGINNGSFEAPVLAAKSYAYNPAASAATWQFSGTAGIATNLSAFTWGLANSPDGNQMAFIQQNGSMSQSVYLTAGRYSLTFMAVQRRAPRTHDQVLQILVDGAVVATVDPSNTTTSTSGIPAWGLYETPFITVTTGVHTITFRGLNPQGGDNTVLVDMVSF